MLYCWTYQELEITSFNRSTTILSCFLENHVLFTTNKFYIKAIYFLLQ